MVPIGDPSQYSTLENKITLQLTAIHLLLRYGYFLLQNHVPHIELIYAKETISVFLFSEGRKHSYEIRMMYACSSVPLSGLNELANVRRSH